MERHLKKKSSNRFNSFSITAYYLYINNDGWKNGWLKISHKLFYWYTNGIMNDLTRTMAFILVYFDFFFRLYNIYLLQCFGISLPNAWKIPAGLIQNYN